MTSARSGAGDPARTLELLWRDPAVVPRRGPQRGLDLDAVVAAATELADREGLEALTMRRVAAALGVGAMTLYTYLPGKAELLDLMLDSAYARMPRTDTTGQPWRQRLIAIAEENRALFEAHPWAAAVSTLRPPLGPGLIAKYEYELAALDGLGLDDVELDDCLTCLLSFVQACARASADARAARQDSAIDDQQWWTADAPLLARVLDERTYPLATRVGTAAGAAHRSAHDPDHAYHFGLHRVLDGLAVLINSDPCPILDSAEVRAVGSMHRDIRASDADRDAVVERLRRALGQGRLTVEEFDERAAAAYAAKTHGDLAVLTRDLPGSLW